MTNLVNLEKKINSELTTKINESKIKHNQLYLNIDSEDLLEVTLFLKNNKYTKFKQLIDITVVDYPEKSKRFEIVYLFLSHEFNLRILLTISLLSAEKKIMSPVFACTLSNIDLIISCPKNFLIGETIPTSIFRMSSHFK